MIKILIIHVQFVENCLRNVDNMAFNYLKISKIKCLVDKIVNKYQFLLSY